MQRIAAAQRHLYLDVLGAPYPPTPLHPGLWKAN